MAVVVVKVTEHCNSRCRYCERQRPAPLSSMSDETLATLFTRIGEHLRGRPQERLELLWHGGEPLVLGARFYRRALALQRQHCADVVGRLSHRVQTNLLAFSPEVADALQAMGVREVGTSFDPQPHLRGPGPRVDSEWYNRRFLRGLALVEARRLSWGVIYVVTRRALERPLEVFAALTNLNLMGRVTLNPVIVERGPAELAVSADEYGDFLGAIFPRWWGHRTRYGDVQPFAALCALGAPAPDEVVAPSEADAQVVLQPGGEVDRCGPDGGQRDRYGDIRQRPLAELLAASAAVERARWERRRATARCQRCRLLSRCQGGGLMDSFSRTESERAADEWCAARLAFLERHVDPLLPAARAPRPAGQGAEPRAS